jgi:hypothetical protein
VRYGQGFSSRCPKCGQYGHIDCQPAPLETPSHNGVYRGTLAPITIPMAVFGEDIKNTRAWAQKASKGHQVQTRLATANRKSKRSALLRWDGE